MSSATGVPATRDSQSYIEWVANIAVDKYAAKSTFFVYIFLGDFNTDPTKWAEDPNLVGTHVVFADYSGNVEGDDTAQQHKIVKGSIPLTGALGDRLGQDKLRNLSPEEISPYLRKELHWRIQSSDGNVIEREEVPSLKVSVAHFSVAVPDSSDQFPTWGQGQKEASITAHRPGGAGEDD
ncbi:hypothetical protein CPB86DRAFT_788050 [Serendipita vermifera]|nr:hypothetical protein CPB86DRAFT_788050 [Serendipita vermifera]